MKALVILLMLLSGALGVSALSADELRFDIQGLDDPLLTNARASITNLAHSESAQISQRRLDRIRQEAEERLLDSLKPFGYYKGQLTSNVIREPGVADTIVLQVERGQPVRISEANIEVNGPGIELPEIRSWRNEWPLPTGAILNQGVWESTKQQALDTLDYKGFIKAHYSEHRIEIDLDRNEAKLNLVLETGPRAVIGDVRFEQDIVREEHLQQLVRFERGQPYDGWLIERLRYDIWKTGFYSTIDVREERIADADPPIVHISAMLEERNRDTWQGSVGFGSDTKMRAQLNWNRHWLSDRGDSLGMGLGWQQKDNRYLFRTNYRIPRGSSRRSYWIAETLYRDEQADFDVSIDDDPNQVFELTNGDIETYLFKGGLLNIRDVRGGYQQITETWFVQYLRENVRYRVPPDLIPIGNLPLDIDSTHLFSNDNSSIAFGVEWDWPVISGQGFETVGHHEQLRMFTADDTWGSPRDFNQVYFSSRWNFMAGENIKLLLRAEVGYSAANVDDFTFSIDGREINVSLTELPNLYRFKAGGSQSVRGYAYESLSNNGIGSNNLVALSVESEWRFRPNWSMAAFYDVGNAFNEWSEMDLKQGAGVGLRWYSIAGAVRLDFASALDLPGDPWRIHFTLGVPLL